MNMDVTIPPSNIYSENMRSAHFSEESRLPSPKLWQGLCWGMVTSPFNVTIDDEAEASDWTATFLSSSCGSSNAVILDRPNISKICIHLLHTHIYIIYTCLWSFVDVEMTVVRLGGQHKSLA
jgi:hypothetical protein